LTKFEKKILSQYIIDLDLREFASWLADIENIANYLFEIYQKKYIGKL